jgi:CRP-like cAMP-binding protein
MDLPSEGMLVRFFEQYPLLKYKSKENVYRPDELIDRVAFVKTGYVRIYNQDTSGKEITYSGFKPIFYMSYFYSKKRTPNQYYFQALTDLQLWKAPLADFEKYLLTNPQQSIDLIGNILGSFHEVLLSWENSLSGDAYNRVGKLLLALAKEYGVKSDHTITIDFHTTHQLIASMLGITRETASIQIKKMENDTLISQQKNTIVINNMEQMSAKFSQ